MYTHITFHPSLHNTLSILWAIIFVAESIQKNMIGSGCVFLYFWSRPFL